MKYRKKPIEIEAIRFDLAPATADQVLEMAGPKWADLVAFDEEGAHIETLEGQMLAKPGDYIIKGAYGELYPCKARIFEATYDPVD